jgi:hypothetical protein
VSSYVPLSHAKTQEILEHLAQVLKPQPIKDNRLRELARQFSQYDTDCLRVGVVLMKGFNAIRSEGLATEPVIRAWVMEEGVEFRATRIVASLIALGLCAALDDSLPKLVRYGKRRSPAFMGRYQLLGEKRLDAAIRPSGKRDLDWPRELLKVFSVKWDDLIGEALKDLVGARNGAAHELPQESQDYWSDRIRVWGESATWLVQSAMLRLDDLLARNR